jgi:hypothetical protein
LPSYRLRFVGQTSLPKSISQNEVDEEFSLGAGDPDDKEKPSRALLMSCPHFGWQKSKVESVA